MKKVWFILGTMGIVGLPIAITGVIIRDFLHPETWDDPMRNPYFYGPFGILAGLIAISSILCLWIAERQRSKQKDAWQVSGELLKRIYPLLSEAHQKNPETVGVLFNAIHGSLGGVSDAGKSERASA